MLPIPQIETFHLGPVTIYAWGLMVSLGIIVGLIIAVAEGKRKGVSLDHITSLALYVLIGAIIGSRLFYVIVHFSDFESIWDVFKIWQGGLIFYGGFIGAIIPAYIYIRKHKLNFWQIADIFAPALALGTFIGRIGCVLIQDHMGVITNFFMAQNYMGEMRHNTAIYSSLNGLIMFIILWSLRKRIKTDGILFLIFTLEYAVTRYFIDQLRAFDIRWHGLTGSQWICIVLFIVTAIFLWKKLSKSFPNKGLEARRKIKDKNKIKILKLFDNTEKITNNNVQEICKVSDAQATRYLEELEKEGRIAQIGEKKGVYYIKK